MLDAPRTIERAFELAKSGKYANVAEIKRQLRAEGYSDAQIVGPSLIKQIRNLCITAR